MSKQTQEPVGGMKWVKVTDKLPDNSDEVHIISGLGEKNAAWYDKENKCWWWHDEDSVKIEGKSLDGLKWLDENYTPPHAPIKTEGEGNQMRSADYWFEKSLHIPVAKKWQRFGHADIVKELIKQMMEYYTPAPPSPVGIDVSEWSYEYSGRTGDTEVNRLIKERIASMCAFAKKNGKEPNCNILYGYEIGFKAGYSASLPQSSTEEEKELWEEVSKIVIKHYTSYNYTDQDENELQSKFKISKR